MKLNGLSVWKIVAAFLLALVFTDGGVSVAAIDANFGQDGVALLDSGLGDDEALALATQQDGKILVAGNSHNGAVKILSVARFLSDGTPDREFGSDGRVTLSVGNGNTIAQSIAVQNDGGIVVTGVADDGRHALVVLRLTQEGNVDASFAVDGQLVLAFDSGDVKNSSLLLSSDESVMVAGTIESTEKSTQLYFLKLNSLGQLDAGFGDEGKVLADRFEGAVLNSLGLVEGKKILGGGTFARDGVTTAGVVALQWDGTIDETFGENGQSYVIPGGSESSVKALKVRSDGNIFVTGYFHNGSYKDTYVAQLNESGVVISGFGENGLLRSGFEYENVANALAIQQDGSLAITGFAAASTSNELFVLTFSESEVEDVPGQQALQAGLQSSIARIPTIVDIASYDDVGNSIAMLPGGQVLVAGAAGNGQDTDLILMRFVEEDLTKTVALEADESGVTPSGYKIVTEAVTDITRVSAVSGGKITEMETATCSASCNAECGSAEGSCYDSCNSTCQAKPTVARRGVCFNIKKNPEYEEDQQEDTTSTTTTTAATTSTSTTTTQSGTGSSPSIFPQNGSLAYDIIRSGQTDEGSGTGIFVSNIEEITPGIRYYLRAYAVLTDDTVIYGNEVTFKTNDACFIATAAYGSIFSRQVTLLREFRDRYLMSSSPGQRLVGMYYHFSPPIADAVEKNDVMKILVRIMLVPAIVIASFLMKTTFVTKILIGAGGACCVLLITELFKISMRYKFYTGGRRVSFAPFKKCNESGFTLIELLVVLVIIGILAGYIGPKIMGHPEEAKRTKAHLQIQAIETALKMYKLDNGVYPSTEQGLQALVEPPASGKLPPKWRDGGYLEKKKIPPDPWGNSFVYLSPGVNGDLDLSSYGADGEAGGEGDAKDVNNWEIE